MPCPAHALQYKHDARHPDFVLTYMVLSFHCFSRQLLMGAADTRWHRALADTFRSVPPALWRLASPTGSLLPPREPSRPPGCAFVETDGADAALAQAMLTVVFRIVRRGDVPGCPLLPDAVNSDGCREDREGSIDSKRGRGQEEEHQAARPWGTAAEALAATVRASCDGDGNGDGDGEGGVGGDGDADSWMGFAGRLVRLFSDQDDALVDMLLQNLYIFHGTRPAVCTSPTAFARLLAIIQVHPSPPSKPVETHVTSRAILLGGFATCDCCRDVGSKT